MINNDYERTERFDDKRLRNAIFTATWFGSAVLCGGFIYLVYAVR